MNATANSDNRFEEDASRYARYLETPEGRLRTDITFSNLRDFLAAAPKTKSLRALDLGCGTGAASVGLARLGVDVTLLDASPAMLHLAERSITQAGVRHKISIKNGDAAKLEAIFPNESFDVILCHNLLEYVDAPQVVVRKAARLLRDSSAILSVLVRNQAGEVLKAALQAGDLASADNNLSAEWGLESLYEGEARLFTVATVESMLRDASLTTITRRGVRVFSDYLPATVSRSAEYERILALEQKLGTRQEFIGIARYLHCLARAE